MRLTIADRKGVVFDMGGSDRLLLPRSDGDRSMVLQTLAQALLAMAGGEVLAHGRPANEPGCSTPTGEADQVIKFEKAKRKRCSDRTPRSC